VTAKTFRDIGVDDALCTALEAKGITHPFPIQELALPLALEGHDLIGQARTGTGKTLAFGLPLLQRLDPSRKATQALVIVPTRELCVQVHDDLQVGSELGLSTISVYGGVPYEAQIEALTTGVHVVVGTPGRLLDHLNRGNLDLSEVRTLVLDEADEMLDMGFLPDVERLIQGCNTERHSMLFSATMPTEVVKLARRYLTHPTFTRADTEQHETAPNVEQHFFSVHRMDKPRVLARILQSPNRGGAYVFVRTKHMADRLVDELEGLTIPAVPVHGDLRQTTREKNLDRFRDGSADVLVCTEVAARGLDVENVTHVVNYDCPDDEKMYLHRIGRTARAGNAGVAVTFAEFNEADRLNVIRKAVGATETEVKQIFSTSDELTSLFDLPAERPWDHLAARGGTSDSGARSGRDTNRRGRTDGRSKNRGGSDRSKGRPARDRDTARPSREGDAGSPPRDGREDTGGSGGAEQPASTRTRTRTRSRTRDGGAGRTADRGPGPAEGSSGRDEGASSRTPAAGATPDTSTRARTGPGEPDRERPASGARPRARRQRGGRGSEPETARSTEERAGGAPRRGGGDGNGRPRARDQQAASSGRGGRARRGGGSGGGKGSGGSGGARSRGNAGDDAPREVQPVPKGRVARGDGQPQRARRVRVDHLP
jgi:superfamily II DNA/RNA helicase